MTKAQKFLIEMLEEDIIKAGAAIISINIDLDILNERRKTAEGDRLEKDNAKLEELNIALPRMIENKKLLEDKIIFVKAYEHKSNE